MFIKRFLNPRFPFGLNDDGVKSRFPGGVFAGRQRADIARQPPGLAQRLVAPVLAAPDNWREEPKRGRSGSAKQLAKPLTCTMQIDLLTVFSPIQAPQR